MLDVDIIFPSEFANVKNPDPFFLAEFNAARESGFECFLLDTEKFDLKDYDGAIRSLPDLSSNVPFQNLRDVVLRGWMMSFDEYCLLHAILIRRGYRLCNTPVEYVHCHYLPNALDVIREYSPKTNHLSLEAAPETIVIEQISNHELKTYVSSPGFLIGDVLRAANIAGDNGVIVKDYVKSEKDHWGKACYIPDPKDRNQVLSRVMNLIELRGMRFTGGLVFREFVKFDGLSCDPLEGAPNFNEFRAFWYGEYGNKKLIYNTQYRGHPAAPKPDWSAWEHVANKVRSRFFTMDLAKRSSDGEWMIIELGDGQVAGLPTEDDPNSFYRALRIAAQNEADAS